MIVSGEFGTSKTFATWQPPSAPIVSNSARVCWNGRHGSCRRSTPSAISRSKATYVGRRRPNRSSLNSGRHPNAYLLPFPAMAAKCRIRYIIPRYKFY